ncbi:1-phosphofructokinase family hexose kinase [Microterricola pindariensis]|uniref:Ribokinase n=1 Tax=Microterricola pindariensis TaxID=478010 RepID=A0ABX5ASQ9_9MICO|nr:hexose kinase [Microterricola pindariensis]PPL15987.1 ribokinase [Microterricola pindariensis]
MIITVTPNAALDLTWWVDRIEPGATHRVPSGMARAGGKSLNVARVADQQGLAVLAIATAGGTTGAELELELSASGVPHTLVPVAASTRRSLALYDAGADETSIFNEYGEDHSAAEWAELLAAVDDALPGASCLVGSGSLPPGADTDFYPGLVRRAAAAGIPSVIDTSGPALLAAADAGATVLKPNRDELVAATDIADPIRGARSLIARGARLVLLSLGSAGMIAVSADDPSGHLSARLPEPLAGNPTGAGDAAVAAVASCFAESPGATPPTEAILRRATAWSAAAVLMPLAGEISPLHDELSTTIRIERHTETPS